ncbi:DUF3515 domain-containing protein [Lolliginicoccus suaedae]|uniref:DUF3515 domain-containing protein n=1 Tax=Lolliginicoccus suaedae TaxID=2605429 RepID=UPI0011EC0462|nr:DUF3515 domain-containing protein [Lolliginicoccus suaedae]
MSKTASERYSPGLIATAVSLPAALIVALIAAAVIMQRSSPAEPVAITTVPAPDAESSECSSLMDALPEQLGDLKRAELLDPAPVGAAAWRDPAIVSEPVVLRCGLERPLEFDRASALQMVNGVDWFEISGESMGLDSSTWYAVDRGVYVAVTIPSGSGPTPIQVLSNTVTDALGKQPIDPAPIN